MTNKERLTELEVKLAGEYVGGMTEYWQRCKDHLLSEKGQEITDVLDGPEQECYPVCQKGMTKDTCPYNPNLGCDCGANPPNGNFHVTDPTHGGKVTCYKCGGFILERDHQGYWADHQSKDEFPMDSFHKDCYNPYEHYYGLDKPID
jgi:hypothetical protein